VALLDFSGPADLSSTSAMAASDKLFYWVFQQHPDRILELLPELATGCGGYRFSAPVLKERERRLDGLLQVPGDATGEQPQQPAVILEAQMQADQQVQRSFHQPALRHGKHHRQ